MQLARLKKNQKRKMWLIILKPMAKVAFFLFEQATFKNAFTSCASNRFVGRESAKTMKAEKCDK